MIMALGCTYHRKAFKIQQACTQDYITQILDT